MTQIKDNINVTIAMIEQANTILTFKKAKLTPTAKASILVQLPTTRLPLTTNPKLLHFLFLPDFP